MSIWDPLYTRCSQEQLKVHFQHLGNLCRRQRSWCPTPDRRKFQWRHSVFHSGILSWAVPLSVSAATASFQKAKRSTGLDFSYQLQELNSWVEWMPGNEEPLNLAQIKQAFYIAMSSTRKERYSDLETRLSNEPYKNVVHYFRDQEHRANSRQCENEYKWRRAIKGSGRGFSQRGTPKTKSPRR